MKKISTGALAALLTATLLAPLAGAAGPANVTVRVEGEAQTLLPRSAVATDTTPVLVEGGNSCPGTSAGGAVSKAVAGDLGGSWGAFGFLLKTVKGETHDDPFPADPAQYWSFWVNYRYQDQGLCGTELQEGDDVLLFVDCFSQATDCSRSPLRITDVPATVAPGQAITMKLDEFVTSYDPGSQTTSTMQEPAEDATISAAGQTATTGADGRAQLSFSTPGAVSIAATKPGRVRTAALTCVTTGNDGNCGTQLPPTAVLGTQRPDDKIAPVASFSRLTDGKVYRRRHAPRKLEGTVTPDPSGLLSVRLSILRQVGERCWAFDGAEERFERHRCGGRSSFRIGDRAEWSYLLPRRLARGRYTIRAGAIDKAGNDSVSQVGIRVR
jgi:hypothetical protein